MIRTDGLQRHAGLSTVHSSHKPPFLLFFLKFFPAALKVGVEFRQPLPEVVYRSLEEVVGYEEMLLHVSLFNAVAASRVSMTNLRITSVPLRSMRGSGSE